MTTTSPRQHTAQAQTFSILNYLDKLQPAEGGSYICPNCQGHNLTINNQTGAYQCWNGCECRNIRDKIAPLPNRSDTTSYQNPRRQKTKKSKPPTPPEGEIHLIRLLAPADDIPQPQRDRDKEHGEVLKTTYVYSLTAEGQLTLQGRHRGDLDNLGGAVLDALVSAGALVDDRIACVPRLVIEHQPSGACGVLVEVKALT